MTTIRIPIKHLSVRVPWHDAGWDGSVCKKPRANASCLVLNRIGGSKKDDVEEKYAGMSLDEVPPEDTPPCFSERVNFLCSTTQRRQSRHSYALTSEHHRHIQPTTFSHPPFSVAATPFGWMLKERAWGEKWKEGTLTNDALVERFKIDSHPDNEPHEPDWLRERPWIQGHQNQKSLLDAFFDALHPKKSLVFMYAKQTPLVDEERWMIIGVGQVGHQGKSQEYDYNTAEPPIRSYLWERSVSHSLRPDGTGGVLLPYHDLLARCDNDPEIDPTDCIAFVPNEYRAEFSYASEHVTSATSISVLLAVKRAIENYQKRFGGNWTAQLQWIDQRLGELWELRGPYPGFGSVLCALGAQYGYQLAHYCWESAGENGDPWLALDAAMRNPSTLPADIKEQLLEIKDMWQHLCSKKGEERLALAKLLARMDINFDQAKRWWEPALRTKEGILLPDGNPVPDSSIIENPYMVYECDRLRLDPIPLATVDQGIFPEKPIENKHPVPAPSRMQGLMDRRRFRAIIIEILERAAVEGHTLVPKDHIIGQQESLHLSQDWPVTSDHFEIHGAYLSPLMKSCQLKDGNTALQLNRLAIARDTISAMIEKRLKGKRHEIAANWRKELDEEFKESAQPDTDEDLARSEKAAALAELAAARFAVLIGPAGTGKTTLLKLLCNHSAIRQGGVLLLAPTGKARVRLQEKTGMDAFTLAQFLRPQRYDDHTMRYKVIGNVERKSEYRTVIVDEASMLTEEQLAALMDSLNNVDRLILVGDAGQLSPIGPGRPFADIINHLDTNIPSYPPKVGNGYAELTIPCRHGNGGAVRTDLQLAQWFSGRPMGAGDDDIIMNIGNSGDLGPHLRVCRWDTPADLIAMLPGIVAEELEVDPNNRETSFAVKALGGNLKDNNVYFNYWDNAVAADRWQILSPIRGQAVGTLALNHLIHLTFRNEMKKRATPVEPWLAKVPKPMGPEGIFYGDKVINLRNHRRLSVYPKETPDGKKSISYVANGEIGIVTGPFKMYGKKISLKQLQVAFSSQPGFAYNFRPSELDEDGSYLELAYALTVHKAQGSEFQTSFVIVPNPCRLLSREMLYTAITRQKERVVLLCQGDPRKLFEYRHKSETARRFTNLFNAPAPVQINGQIYDEHHIHRSRQNELMISKSEVLIANELHKEGIAYGYENKLIGRDGMPRYPDFTIMDADSGTTWYWEHLGMLGNKGYERRWQAKLAWYRANDILPHSEGGGKQGTLVTTDETGGFDTHKVQEIIAIIKRGGL